MATFKVKLEGLDKLTREIHRMGKEQELKETLREFGKGAEEDLRAQTIKSFVKGYSTGRIRENVTSELTETGKGVIVGVEDNGTYYADYVEFGTRKMEAEPFMQPMIERQSKEFERKLKELVK